MVKNIFLILTPKEKNKFLKLIVLDVLISLLDILFLITLLFVINFYTMPHSPKRWAASTVLENYPLLLIIIFFILFSTKNLFGTLVSRMQFRFIYDVAARLSENKLQLYLRGNYSEYTNIDSAVFTRKISQQPIEFSHYVLRSMQQIISQVLLIVFTMIGIVTYNIILFPLLLVILVPPVLLMAMIMKNKLTTIRSSVKSTTEKSIQHLNEALSGYVEINSNDKKSFFIPRFNKFQLKLYGYISQQQFIQNLPGRIMEVFAIFGFLVLVLINSYIPGSQTITILTLGAFIAAAYKIIPGIVKILSSSSHIKTYAYSTTDILKDIDQKRENTAINDEIHGVEFKDIFFGYKEKAVLKDFTLKINQGDFVCMTGRSGSGKTTLVNLLLGFLTPDRGVILVNNISRLGAKNYYKRISYSKQQPFMIHDSLIKNITLEESGFDMKRFEEVISTAGLKELMNKSRESWDTIIAEDGKNISGGQKQRIVFARALYKDFDMLILDEPFSELDTETEAKLLQHLQEIASEGKIVLLISHSKAALSYCNKRINLDG